MDLQELLKKRQIREVAPAAQRADDLISSAERDIKAAQAMLSSQNYEWALAISYNAMLSAGMALMARKGYAASSDSHHIAIVQFCASSMPADTSALVQIFNKYRVRRHEVVYGEAGSVGKNEAENAIENARKFLTAIKSKMV